jgi:hypothetical protein
LLLAKPFFADLALLIIFLTHGFPGGSFVTLEAGALAPENHAEAREPTALPSHLEWGATDGG